MYGEARAAYDNFMRLKKDAERKDIMKVVINNLADIAKGCRNLFCIAISLASYLIISSGFLASYSV